MVENPYLIWFLAYFIPISLLILQQKIFKKKIVFKVGLTHLLLLISILISLYFIKILNLGFKLFEINIYFYVDFF